MKPAVFGLLDSTATRPDPPARNWEKELVQEMRVVKMCWAITGSCCNSSSLTVRVQIKWFLDLYICNTYIISFYDTLAGSILFLNLYDQTLRISGERLLQYTSVTVSLCGFSVILWQGSTSGFYLRVSSLSAALCAV